MSLSVASLAVTAALLAVTPAFAADPVVHIDDGDLRGRVEDGLAIYRGVPFAQPPVGALRWRAPQPAARWTGVRDASAFGDDCIQIPFFSPPGPGYVRRQSEDCLTLNVWTPQAAPGGRHRPLAVLVWIYGGAFIMGSSAWPGYDGAALAKQGVVVVSMNYRVGRFGFFAHPALTAETNGEVRGNYGLLDQMAALAWVRANIARFGGDPTRVTVFGESAGGSSINALIVSPLAVSSFDQAIAESATDRAWPTLAQAEAAGVAWSAKLGLAADVDAATLRALSAESVQTGAHEPPAAMSPIIDGRLLPMQPTLAFDRGVQRKLPYLAGSNSYEQSLLKWLPGETERLAAEFGAQRDALLEPYRRESVDGSEAPMLLAAWRDARISSPVRAAVASMANAGQPAYLYRFSYVPVSKRGQWTGTPHGGELPYVFGDVSGPALYGEAAADAPMARLASGYWVRFAKTGDPNGRGEADWPRWSRSGDGSIEFTDDGAATRHGLDAARLDAFDALRLQRNDAAQ